MSSLKIVWIVTCVGTLLKGMRVLVQFGCHRHRFYSSYTLELKLYFIHIFDYLVKLGPFLSISTKYKIWQLDIYQPYLKTS